MINPSTGRPFKSVDEMTGTVVTFRKGVPPVVTGMPLETMGGPVRLLGRPYVRRDPRTIPPREWLYGHTYIRGCLSVLVAPGGSGKSTLAMTEAIAAASGRDLLGEIIPGRRTLRVWYWNGEDPRDEIDRRIEAICQEHGIGPEDLGDRLIISDAGADEIMLAAKVGRDGAEVNDEAAAMIEATIKAYSIDIAIFDPFISIHRVTESDNNGMDLVAKRLAKTAMSLNCGIGLCHHARKPMNGGNGEITMSDSRGASALIDCARIGRTLNFMSEDEANKCGVAVEDRRRFVRIDDGKANLSPRADAVRWLNLVSVNLNNATADRPADFVGVPVAWEMPGIFDGVTKAHLVEVQQRVDRAAREGEYLRKDIQSNAWVGHEVASVLNIDIDADGMRAKVKKILGVWIENGALKMEMVTPKQGNNRHPRPCIVVGEWANS